MKMNLPTNLSGWCMWLFFLVFGLGEFLPAFMGMSFYPWLVGILALGYAVLALLGM